MLLNQLLPLTIDLAPEDDDDTRHIHIEQPHHVDFLVSEGLRVHTSAHIRWKAAGVSIPATLKNVELMLRPQIASDERGNRLLFRPSIEHADFKLLPAFVDRRIATRVNQALEAETDRLSWHIDESFARSVPMTKRLQPVTSFDLHVDGASVEVFDDALVLKINVGMRFVRGEEPPAEET